MKGLVSIILLYPLQLGGYEVKRFFPCHTHELVTAAFGRIASPFVLEVAGPHHWRLHSSGSVNPVGQSVDDR